MSDWILYLVLGVVSIVSALGLLTSRNAVHAALYLVLNFITAAVFYLLMNAPFLAGIQVSVYAGAIMVLFVFVIMLLGSEKLQPSDAGAQISSSRSVMVVSAGVLVVSVVYALLTRGSSAVDAAPIDASPAAIGQMLFTTYSFPFEVVSLLLLAAMVGAIVLAREK
jgi:NADH-quinone oxidoreductase subunit J